MEQNAKIHTILVLYWCIEHWLWK